jgi:hypothetical protein
MPLITKLPAGAKVATRANGEFQAFLSKTQGTAGASVVIAHVADHASVAALKGLGTAYTAKLVDGVLHVNLPNVAAARC